jgi:hypothetical protein
LKLRKRQVEVMATFGCRPSTFLEQEFTDTMAEICVFHIGSKHSLRDCTVLKEELDILEEPKRPRGNDFNDHHYKGRYNDHYRMTIVVAARTAMTTTSATEITTGVTTIITIAMTVVTAKSTTCHHHPKGKP